MDVSDRLGVSNRPRTLLQNEVNDRIKDDTNTIQARFSLPGDKVRVKADVALDYGFEIIVVLLKAIGRRFQHLEPTVELFFSSTV